MASTRRKRGKASRDAQLSVLQRKILVWLYEHETDVDAMLWDLVAGKKDKVKELNQKGVPWSAKRFYGDAPTSSQEVSLSRSLTRLQTKGLIVCFDSAGGLGSKRRTSHVKLTQAGREAALFELEYGQTARQLRDLRQLDARRKKLRDLRAQRKEAEYWQRLNEDGELESDIGFQIGSLGPIEILVNSRTNEAKEITILDVKLLELDAEIQFLEDSIAAYPEAVWKIGESTVISLDSELDASRAQHIADCRQAFLKVFWDEAGEQPISDEVLAQMDAEDDALPF